MFNQFHWTCDSFGSNCPANWEDIADAANRMIDEYAASVSSDDAEDLILAYSEQLWSDYCSSDEIAGIKSVW